MVRRGDHYGFLSSKQIIFKTKSCLVTGDYYAKGLIIGGFFLNNQNCFEEKYKAEHLWEKQHRSLFKICGNLIT